MNWYFIAKALHIIGFVSWFAALFYLVRLFVYHREAWELSDPEGSILRRQYAVMEKRLYQIIQTPAMVLTLLGGISMLLINSTWLSMGWMHLKLLLVLILIFYHFSCGYYLRRLAIEPSAQSSFTFRLYNEIPTLILIAVVMLAVWKSLSGLWYGLFTLFLLGLLFFAAARLYRRKREKKP